MKAELARRARQRFPLDRWFQVIEIRDQIEASFSDRRTSRPASLLKFVGQKHHQRGDPPNPQKAGNKSEAENRRYEACWLEGDITRAGIRAYESYRRNGSTVHGARNSTMNKRAIS
jgi:hypothetical protein